MNWTSGYRADIDYTYGYYGELSAGTMDFALLMSGYEPPARRGMRYLELGYGQGVTVNIAAASNDAEYWGADFNPAHAAHAQSLARVSGAKANFVDDSFAELLARDDLPAFDIIALHGVWSWVSDENRRAIVEIIRRRLKVGGACYISYNTLPGWAMGMPLRHMMTLHAETVGSDVQGVVGRIDAAISFGTRLAEAGGGYFAANPAAKTRLTAIAGQNRNYVAHEYFNRDWTPMYFSDVSQWLSDAKLGYAAPANVLDQIDAFNLTAQQIELMGSLPAGDLRETVRDYLINQQFRRDLFTRGARRLSLLERLERLNEVSVALTSRPEDTALEINTVLGKIGLREDIYAPLIAAMADDKGSPKTIGQLARRPKLANIETGVLIEGVAVLIGGGRAHIAKSEAEIAVTAPRTRRLNAHLIARARSSDDITHLASPVIGGGVAVSRFDQMFIGARAANARTPDDWAREAWTVLARQGQSIIKNGEVLNTPEANLDELKVQAAGFAQDRLPLLQRLRVAD
jgi:SAM-dependent methyltransferase